MKNESPWKNEHYAPGAIPTMVAPDELSYLHWLGRIVWDGHTDVVEFGPWLGGTTSALATGMKLNAHRIATAKLHTIDNFIWRQFMEERAPLNLQTGTSFKRFLEDNLAEHGDIVVIHEASLPDDVHGDTEFEEPIRDTKEDILVFTGAMIGSPVRIVFVDGAKSWRAFHHVLSELQLASNALLVLQDFQNWASYWVPMMIALLREQGERIELVHVLPSDTVSVRLPHELNIREVPVMPQEISVEQGDLLLRLAAEWLEPLDPAAAQKVALASVIWLGSNGCWRDARKRMGDLAATWEFRTPLAPLLQTMRWVGRHTGSPVSLGRKIMARRAVEGVERRVRRKWHSLARGVARGSRRYG
jgi:hypothetical protein